MAKILVLDDRPVDRQLLVTLLGYAGHRVAEAGSGAEALDLVRTERPDLIIADVLMPTIDGYEFVRRLRMDPTTAATAVMFYTAIYHEQEARALAWACGVQHFLTKPTEPEVILRTVEEALAAATVRERSRLPAEFDHAHLSLLSDKLEQNVRALEAANARLAALIDLSLHLASEPDALFLLNRCCQAVRGLLGAECAAIGILDDDGQRLRDFITSGMNYYLAGERAEPLRADEGVLGVIVAERRALRLHGQDARSELLGLPAGQPPTGSFLGVPVASPTHVYGWLYVTGKLGAAEFDSEDENLALMLAGLLAVAYENAWRYEVIQRHARELEQRVAEAQAAVRVRDEFLSVAAHELRTPITSLRVFAQLLLRRFDRHTAFDLEQLPPAMRNFDEQTDKLSRLVTQLLDVSRLAGGKLVLEREPTDLASLITGVVTAAQERTARHTLAVAAPPSVSVFADPLRIEQVVTNLVDNAIKFSPDGGAIQVEVSRVNVAGGRAMVCLAVRDHGIGIPPEHREHIFDRSYQAYLESHRSGMGLGLYISRQIVELHGGELRVEHPPDGGTRFVVLLPVALGGVSAYPPMDTAHAVREPAPRVAGTG